MTPEQLMPLVFASGLSFVVLMSLPFSIAYFYERVFKRRVFPLLFIISAIFFIASFSLFFYDIASITGSGFFAAGGILLAVASLRLYLVMTGGRR